MWNPNEKNYFAKMLSITSKSYDKILDLDVAMMITTDLEDLDFESCLRALQTYRHDSKNKFWPKGADIRAIVQPSPDSRVIAIELARKIERAVTDHGWNWENGFFASDGSSYWKDNSGNVFSSFQSAVVSELGDIGWHVIASRGGWLNVRESVNQMEEGMFIAQMRDQIQATIMLKQQGIDITKIQMPEKTLETPGIELTSAKQILNRLDLK